jgi:hypothetical protein
MPISWIKGMTTTAFVAAALVAAAGCESNPPAMQPGALEAKGKLQQCCDQVDAAFHRMTPGTGPRSEASHAWEEANMTCKNQLAEFQNDLAGSIHAVQKSLGKEDLFSEAPICKR